MILASTPSKSCRWPNSRWITRGATIRRNRSRWRRRWVVRRACTSSSKRRTPKASPCCSMWSTTTSDRATLTSGASMVGAASTTMAAFTFTTTVAPTRPGAIPVPITGARKSANTFATTPGSGSTTTGWTACVSIPSSISAIATGTTTTRPTISQDGWGLLQRINNDIRAQQPWKITVAEDLQNNDWITRDTGAGGAGFGSQWDAAFVHPIRDAVITANDADRDLGAVSAALLHGYNADAARRVVYTESHDEVANGHARVPEEIWPGNAGGWFSRKRSTLGAAMVFAAPGIPMIFQGQEFLEDKYFQDSVPLDWTKLTTYAGIHTLYRDLIRLRRNWFNQTRGLSGQQIHVHHINHADKVLGLHRWANGGSGDDVVVVANFANRSYTSYTLGFPRAGQWRVRFNSDWKGYSTDFGNQPGYDTVAGGGPMDNMPFQANVGLGPYAVLILSQDNG